MNDGYPEFAEEPEEMTFDTPMQDIDFRFPESYDTDSFGNEDGGSYGDDNDDPYGNDGDVTQQSLSDDFITWIPNIISP